jgi:hypothetical protein
MRGKMKTFIALLFFPVVAAVSAPAQVTRGTVGVIYYTNTEIIMAADSRSTDMYDDTLKDECKIAALGRNMIFVSTGVSGYDSGDPRFQGANWRSAGEAHRIFDRLSAGGSHRPTVVEVAGEWSRAMVRNETLLYGRLGDELLEAASDGILTQAMFGGAADDGSLTLISVNIMIQPDDSPAIRAEIGMELPPDSWGVIGEGAIFTEFFQGASERAKKEAAQWEEDSADMSMEDQILFRMIRYIDLTIAYDQSGAVGGPIDAVQLEQGKEIRWRQRKAACPTE